jgi:hypothetical protein
MQKGFPDQSSTAVASTLRLPAIFLVETLVAPLIATPNVDRAIEDKKDGQKSYATCYTCNSHLQKGITILFCKQIGQCPSTNYASSLSGFKILGKLK